MEARRGVRLVFGQERQIVIEIARDRLDQLDIQSPRPGEGGSNAGCLLALRRLQDHVGFEDDIILEPVAIGEQRHGGVEIVRHIGVLIMASQKHMPILPGNGRTRLRMHLSLEYTCQKRQWSPARGCGTILLDLYSAASAVNGAMPFA